MNAVLVTGATGGIGQALCAAFRDAGYRVLATDSDARPCACDAFLPLDLARLADDVAAGEGFAAAVRTALDGAPLRVLVNNAAVQTLGGVAETAPTAFGHSLAVNVTAPYALSHLLYDELVAARGVVLNIGSVHAELTKPGFTAYSVSKAALAGLTRALALDFAPHGVRVNEIRPGATATPMLLAGFADDPAGYAAVAATQPLGRLGEPREIAAMAVFLASAQAGFVTGAALKVDGGIAARLHDPR